MLYENEASVVALPCQAKRLCWTIPIFGGELFSCRVHDRDCGDSKRIVSGYPNRIQSSEGESFFIKYISPAVKRHVYIEVVEVIGTARGF